MAGFRFLCTPAWCLSAAIFHLPWYLAFVVKRWDWLGEKLQPMVNSRDSWDSRDSKDPRDETPETPVCCKSPSKVCQWLGKQDLWREPCVHQCCLNFFWWCGPMPQLCTRMQNNAAMPEKKTMLFGDKKSLAPQLHKFTKTEHCLGAASNPCTAPCTDAIHVGLHGTLQHLPPVLGLAAERTGTTNMPETPGTAETPSFEKLLTHFGLSMGKLRSKSHPTMIAIATDRWRPALHWKAKLVVRPSMADFTRFLGVAEGGASTSWSVSTTVLRTKCTNIRRVYKHWDCLFDSPQPRSTEQKLFDCVIWSV